MPLPEIRVVRSHPVALDQCRRLLATLPGAEAIAAGTTADAAAQARDADPTEAAIASERAAALHGLVMLAADVGDHPEAFTRFVAISNRTQLGGAPTGGSPSRSRPTTGRARSTARSSPSPATRSTSSS